MLSETSAMFGLAPWSFIKYLLLIPINIILVLASWILSPFLAAYSVIRKISVLPGFLQWFSVIDDDLDGGQHQLHWPVVTGFRLWWQRTLWIIRNPAHGWQSKVLGYRNEFGAVNLYTREWKNGPGDQFKGYITDTFTNKVFFTIKADISISKTWYLKLYAGWANDPYDGVYSHYLFQPFIPKRKKL